MRRTQVITAVVRAAKRPEVEFKARTLLRCNAKKSPYNNPEILPVMIEYTVVMIIKADLR
jgi:hypothetical protein